jgi:hypothetical protein
MDETELQRFTIKEEINRRYRRFNAVGTHPTVRLLPPQEGEESKSIFHFLARVSELSTL